MSKTSTKPASSKPHCTESKSSNDPNLPDISQDQLMAALRFYLLASTLKDKIRSGWDSRHWDILAKRVESVAEHCFKACILAISIHSACNEQCTNVDIYRVITILVLHEIGEVLIGDITPFDGVSPTEKSQIEAQAVADITDGLALKNRILDLFTEFEAHFTDDARFAHLCDKLEADLQAKVYQDQGEFRPLNEARNEFLANNPIAQEIIANGAQTPFDVWYEYDKHHYQDSPLFANLLELAQNNDLADLLIEYSAPFSAQS